MFLMAGSRATEREKRALESRFNGLFFWSYCLLNVYGTYLNLYFKRIGLSGTAIGTLSAVFSLVAVILTPWIGSRFDAVARKPARFLGGLAFFSGLIFYGLLLPLPFAGRMALMALLSLAWTPFIPIINSLSLHSPAATGAASRGFGGYRRWGSLGFAVAGVVTGWLAGRFGITAIFPVYAACGLVLVFLSMGIPPEPLHPHGAPPPFAKSIVSLLRSPAFLALALVALTYSVGSSICWTFRSIYLDSIHVSELNIGLIWLLPIAAEIVVFTWGEELVSRFGGIGLVLAGNLVGGARWWLLSSVTSLPVVYLVEVLHGVAFALYFMGAIALLRKCVPPTQGATAQILFNSSFSGVGSTAGAYIGGMMFDRIGVIAQLRTGGTILALSGLAAVFILRRYRR